MLLITLLILPLLLAIVYFIVLVHVLSSAIKIEYINNKSSLPFMDTRYKYMIYALRRKHSRVSLFVLLAKLNLKKAEKML